MTDRCLHGTADQFRIVSLWRPRGETPEGLADRWIELIERLAGLHPLFTEWFESWTDRFTLSQENYSKIVDDIRSSVHHTQGDPPDPSFGYNWHANNTSTGDWGPRNMSLMAHAGGRRAMFFESVTLKTDPYHEADPAILDFNVFKGALLAIAESFDTDEAIAFPSSVSRFWPDRSIVRPRLRLAWMTYVAARFAPLVSPPRTALVEHRPDGGLFMAATRERFSTDNPDHMRVAQEIVASAPTFLDVMPNEQGAE